MAIETLMLMRKEKMEIIKFLTKQTSQLKLKIFLKKFLISSFTKKFRNSYFENYENIINSNAKYKNFPN